MKKHVLFWVGIQSENPHLREKHGDFKYQAAYHIADQLRGVNKLPLLNYGPRTMKAMDTYFTQIIGRGRLRQIAFDDVWDRAKISNKNLSDKDFD